MRAAESAPSLLRRRWPTAVAVVSALVIFGDGRPESDDAARYVLAVGWLGHGLWDLVHFRSRRVVPWQWAEWCAVVDVAGGAAFLLLP